LRLDTAWLQRQLAEPTSPDTPRASAQQLASVVDDMAARCAEVQADIRDLLVRLRPLGPGVGSSGIDWTEFIAQLDALVAGWRASASRAAQAGAIDFCLSVQLAGQPAPAGIGRDLALAIYRLSQEALTNIARHARANRAELSLAIEGDSAARWLVWRAFDDGIGIDDPAQALRRGNGLGGMQERVWALGGVWQIGQDDQRGLVLQARLPLGPRSK
jgi:two-component system sensor histidine kinase UhpB